MYTYTYTYVCVCIICYMIFYVPVVVNVVEIL